MAAFLSLTESQILTVSRAFMLNVLPTGVSVVQGQDNRAPEPLGDFVAMWPILRRRLATNTDADTDAVFTGSIAATTMTITHVFTGALQIGSTVFGVGVALNTIVTAFLTGTGGLGTYTVSVSQTVGSETLAAGQHNMLEPIEITLRCNVQGPSSTDNAQIIATAFRDSAAADFFTAAGFAVQPLYVEDPRQTPFFNGEDQYEYQWTVDLVMQGNPVVSTPQQFADTVTVQLVEIDAAYPP